MSDHRRVERSRGGRLVSVHDGFILAFETGGKKETSPLILRQKPLSIQFLVEQMFDGGGTAACNP